MILAVLVMAAVILAYDQLLFRPIVAWADKFRFEQTAAAPASALLGLRSVAARQGWCAACRRPSAGSPRAYRGCRSASPARRGPRTRPAPAAWRERLWLVVVLAAVAYALWRIVLFTQASLSADDLLTAIGSGLLTLARVVVLIALASLVWVPIGVWIGLRPLGGHARAAGGAVPGGLSGQRAVSHGGRGDRALSISIPTSGSAR